MNRLTTWFSAGLVALSLALVAPVHAQQPLKIGFGMSLTGPLAGNGKAALIAMQIWAEDVNAKGGILGRKVELVFYDDQTNPSTVPSIYSKLIDVDKVDLLVSGYGTNVIAPAMPIVMQRNMAFMTLFGLNVNSKFNYRRSAGRRASSTSRWLLRPSRKRLRWWARTPSIRRWRWKARASRPSAPG